MRIRCVIVDDEPIARNLLVNFAGYIPDMEVVAVCSNALDARTILMEQPPDLLFLDIHMPVLDGLQFLSTLKNAPMVIFTTAYKEYATNAFDLAAIDYLVKPFSLDRFLTAIDKVYEKLQRSLPEKPTLFNHKNILVKEGTRIHNIEINHIVYAEAKGNYTQVVTHTGAILANTSLTSFEKKLPTDIFVRIHRSFIVNKSKVVHIEGNQVSINKRMLPLGSHFKPGFLHIGKMLT
jgi:DNA-binding LytR/AlgR family response regulator